MKNFSLILVVLAAILVGCNGSNNKDREALLKAQYQHQIDSLKLANAQEKLDAANQRNHEKEKSEASETKEKVVSAPVSNCEYSWLSHQYVTESDIMGMSSWELCTLRNAIYAMHGRKFKRADLRAFFGQFSWYRPLYDEVKLSKIESRNVQFIKSYE